LVTSVIIGVDPHKRSHTAVVLDADEAIAAQLRTSADRRQTDRLLAWADQWPERIWAVENTNGLGRLLAQQLVRHGESVVDVPATLTARTRRLSGHSGRKTKNVFENVIWGWRAARDAGREWVPAFGP
jgi:transposase